MTGQPLGIHGTINPRVPISLASPEGFDNTWDLIACPPCFFSPLEPRRGGGYERIYHQTSLCQILRSKRSQSRTHHRNVAYGTWGMTGNAIAGNVSDDVWSVTPLFQRANDVPSPAPRALDTVKRSPED